MRVTPLVVSGLLVTLLQLSWNALGGENCGCCCPHCGGCEFDKTCRLVPHVTKVPHVEYSCKCEDVCVPGKSCYVGKECVADCDGNCHEQHAYAPTCGRVFMKVTPAKKTTMIEKCGYKCVVEYVCCKCGKGTGVYLPPAGPVAAPAPAAPQSSHWHQSN